MRRKLEFVANKELADIRFMSWPMIAIFTVVVCLMLFFLYPKARLNSELKAHTTPSAITADYLKILLGQEPNNDDVRTLYAQQLVGLNEFQEASVQIRQLKSSEQATLLEYQIDRSELYAQDEKSPGRQAKAKLLRATLAKINNQNPDLNQLVMLLEDAAYLKEKDWPRFLSRN